MKKEKEKKKKVDIPDVDAAILARRENARMRYRLRMRDPAYKKTIRERRKIDLSAMSPKELAEHRRKIKIRVERYRAKKAAESTVAEEKGKKK